MHSYSFLVAAFALSFITLARADCSTFTPSTNYTTAFRDVLAISPVKHCLNGSINNAPVQANNSALCSWFGPTFNASCNTEVFGYLTTYGHTNLSVSSSDAASLFDLLPTYTYDTSNPQQTAHPAQSLCRDLNNIFGGCILNNSTSYFTLEPMLACINGTFSGCSGGPVVDGTPAEMCGVVPLGGSIKQVYAPSPSFNNGYYAEAQCTPSAGSAVRATTWIAALVTVLVVGIL